MSTEEPPGSILPVYVLYRTRDAEPGAGVLCELGIASLEEDFYSIKGCDDGFCLYEAPLE